MVISQSYTETRQNLAQTLNTVEQHLVEVVVHRAGHAPAVIVDLGEYESLKETAHLLRSPANALRLMESIRQLDSGGGTARELLDPDR
jgi:antitoxin YefM